MAGIQKIVVIKDTPFTERDLDRFGLEILKKNAFGVEYWDASPVFFRGHALPEHAEMERRHPEYRAIRSMDELCSSITAEGPSSWIHLLIPLSWSSLGIYRSLSHRSGSYSVEYLGAVPVRSLPDPGFSSSIARKIRKLPKLSLKRIAFSWCDRVLFSHHRLFGIMPVPVCLLGGEKTRTLATALFPLESSTALLWVHAHDYDTYLRAEAGDAGRRFRNYAVFLDSNLPFHPDYRYSGETPVCSGPEYFAGLERFFAAIREISGLEVLVAAHPTADPARYLQYFERDRVFWGETADLVRHASLVLNHQSTAINFAILFRKPVLFLTSDAIEGSLIGPEIAVMADAIGKKVTNIDRPHALDLGREMEVDEGAYDQYARAYIKAPGTARLPVWQIVADYLRSLP